jgi:hypothetical protein
LPTNLRYRTLVDRIERLVARGEHPVLYVTFNYDTLLERAISDTVIQGFPAINAYISYQRRTLIKLHGSVNWRRKTDGLLAPLSGGQPQQNAEWLMDRFENIRLTREYEVGLWHQFIIRQPVFLPAIAVPTEHKAIGDFELPEEHLNALRELLPRVDQVLVIGWRGHEDHFWELWHECRPQPATMNVVVVAENQQAAGEVAGHLHGMGMSTRVEAAQARGFTGYLAEGGLPGLFLP